MVEPHLTAREHHRHPLPTSNEGPAAGASR
jgi:hypothetical protein